MKLALLLLLLALPAYGQRTVSAPGVLSETRVERTIFEYAMQATLTNGGVAAKGVIGTVTSGRLARWFLDPEAAAFERYFYRIVPY